MISGFSVLISSSHDRLGSAGLANKLNASRLIRFRYSGRWACLWGGRWVCGGGGGRIKARSVQGCASKKCMMLIFFFNPCTRSPVGVGSTRSEHTFLACTTAARFKYGRPVCTLVRTFTRYSTCSWCVTKRRNAGTQYIVVLVLVGISTETQYKIIPALSFYDITGPTLKQRISIVYIYRRRTVQHLLVKVV